jgi:hypothetical protein
MTVRKSGLPEASIYPEVAGNQHQKAVTGGMKCLSVVLGIMKSTHVA